MSLPCNTPVARPIHCGRVIPLTSDEDVAAALDALVAGGPLTVAFQPIVDLQSGEPIGYEVLGRCGPLDGPLAAAAKGPATLLALAERHDVGCLRPFGYPEPVSGAP